MRKRLPEQIIKRVIDYKTQKFEDVIIDGKLVVSGYIGELIGIVDDHTLQYSSKGVFIKNNSACWGGICYNPKLCLGAENARTVNNAWKWFLSKVKNPEQFESELEKTAVLEWVLTGRSTIYLPKILNLAVDLFRLEKMNVDISKKLFEINRNIVGNFKKAKKQLKKLEIDRRYKNVAHYLADLSAETRIAVIAKLLKYDVELHMAHDVIVGTNKIQVKNIRLTHNPQSVLNSIQRGFDHDADIVVVHHDIPLDGEAIQYASGGKWYGDISSIYEGIDTALVLHDEGKKIVLFLTGTLKGYFSRILILT